MFKIEFNINLEQINYNVIYENVAKDLISEIKRLIKSGKNTDNESLIKKKNGKVPDFKETGLMLNSISYELTEKGFEIFVSDSNRAVVAFNLNQTNNWTFFTPSEYLDEYCTNRFEYYLQLQLDNI